LFYCFDCHGCCCFWNFFATKLHYYGFEDDTGWGVNGDGWSRSDVEAGGETVFPASQVNSSLVVDWDELTECAKAGLSVRPHMGDALLFWSMKPDATLDASSLHGGCPVVKGNKWSATKWLHVDQYSVPS
jgi:hypothetical protein